MSNVTFTFTTCYYAKTTGSVVQLFNVK